MIKKLLSKEPKGLSEQMERDRFRKRFERVRPEMLRQVIRNFEENGPKSRKVRRLIGHILYGEGYSDQMILGTYMPTEQEVSVLREILKAKELAKKANGAAGASEGNNTASRAQ